ncbi:MAG: polysaccharide biosynthesis protein, partial [Clostridia bacterium]|nr:polysaccharide biosynthesis protein [Clostridia bacterium]
FSLEIFSSMLDISWYYQGIENFKLQTVRNFIVKLAGLVLILVLVREPGDLWKYIVIMLAANFLGNGSLWLNKLRADPFAAPDRARFGGRLKKSLAMFLPQIATIVYAQLDRVMVGGLIRDGNLQVGVYDNAEKVVKIALTVVTSIALVMLSRVANSSRSEDREKTREYVRFSFRLYMLLSVPIALGLGALAGQVTERLFAGAEGAAGIAPVMQMLCPIVVFIGGSSVFGTQYLLPLDRLKPYTVSVFTGMVINLAANALLIPPFGAMGAAGATALAEFSVLAVQMFALRREFSPVMYLRCWRNVAAGLVMFGALLLLRRVIPGASYLYLILQILAGAVVYFLCLLLLRDPLLTDVLRRLFRRRKA